MRILLGGTNRPQTIRRVEIPKNVVDMALHGIKKAQRSSPSVKKLKDKLSELTGRINGMCGGVGDPPTVIGRWIFRSVCESLSFSSRLYRLSF